MGIPRWDPPKEPSKQEQFLLTRLRRTRKLFGFLRELRHELFDAAFQDELATMYRQTGAGRPPKPPAMMAMAVLIQGYLGASDAEAVELTVVDLRWQMVLGCLGAQEPAFSQGALLDFRQRLIHTDMDRRLLERTVELARKTGGFDPKKLPKTLRVAIDSSPLEGAGRVEDTINLLAHAARKVVGCVAALLTWKEERVCSQAGIPLLLESSVKKALDLEWSDPAKKATAIKTLFEQVASLERWITLRLPEEMERPPLKEELATMRQIIKQDLEPDPGGGGVRIREGVAEDRRISIEDPEMRHGRKSKSKRFNGYKRHIAADLDSELILAAAVTPANRPEEEAAPALKKDIEAQDLQIGELFVDRGYINSPVVDEILGVGGDVVCKPWVARNGKGVFAKSAFNINVRDMTITCPAGEVEKFVPGSVVEFDPEACDHCPLRPKCTMAATGNGRTITTSPNEKLQKRLRLRIATHDGRERIRERVGIEHRLAHIGQRQGRRARYVGSRKNLFDLRRASALQNLETIHRRAA